MRLHTRPHTHAHIHTYTHRRAARARRDLEACVKVRLGRRGRGDVRDTREQGEVRGQWGGSVAVMVVVIVSACWVKLIRSDGGGDHLGLLRVKQ